MVVASRSVEPVPSSSFFHSVPSRSSCPAPLLRRSKRRHLRAATVDRCGEIRGKGGYKDQDESVGDRGRIVRILERHGDGRRGDTSSGLSWCFAAEQSSRVRARAQERERERERRGNEPEWSSSAEKISSRSRFLGTWGPRARLSTKRFRSFDIPNLPWLVLVLFDRPSVAFVAALKRRVFALSRSDVAN